MCSARTAETGAITHPLLLDALLHYLRKHYEGLKISVVESDATVVHADLFIKWLGYLPILERWNAHWVNLSKEPIIRQKIAGLRMKEVPVPRILEEAFLITVPKLKTNLLTGLTCCLKNQFGCLPMIDKSIYHPHIDDVIVDLQQAMRPQFCIVDAIIAMGGVGGPGAGVPLPLKTILCGSDPVAVDALGARLLGFNPWLVGHIRKASFRKIGSIRYRVIGDPLPKVDAEVNWIEMQLLRLMSSIQMRALLRSRRAWRKLSR
jgi:uncharacterized protein (DUF362 family)